jgi:hypothetical protein
MAEPSIPLSEEHRQPSSFEFDKQLYRFVRLGNYVNRRGKTIFVVYWQTKCPTCGVTFELFTVPDSKWPSRRCQACKAPGRKVCRERRDLALSRMEAD